MKYRQMMMSFALFGATLLCAGCGSSVDDSFTFGSGHVFCGNRTITVEAPFALGVKGQVSESAAKDAANVQAEGHNRYMQILVMGDAGQSDIRAAADKAISNIKLSSAVSELKTKEETVTIDGKEAIKLNFSFIDTERGKKTALTVDEYIFEKDGVLWRVMYQYLTGDETGKALAERVSGKIRFGARF